MTIDNYWCLLHSMLLCKCIFEFFLMMHVISLACTPSRFCNFHKIYFVIEVLYTNISLHKTDPATVVPFLSTLVVDDNFDHWNVVSRGCRKLIHIHTETSVSCNVDYHFIWISDFALQGWLQDHIPLFQDHQMSRMLRGLCIFIKLCCPHLMLSNFR